MPVPFQVKTGAFQALDCGANFESWHETFIQLWDVPPEDDRGIMPVAKFLATRGEGLHHVGYRVESCAAALEQVRATGGRLIDEEPRPGSRGTTVAFIHPKGAFGTLVELVEE